MSFLCVADPEYGWTKKLKALEPHKWVAFRNAAVSLRGDGGGEVGLFPKWKLPDTQAELKESQYIGGDLLMDGEELNAWNEAGIEMHVKRVKGLASNSTKLPDVIYQISVANVGLMQIQCVEVLEDACTYELQKWLDRGWRILSVCPPNDTRRPSYVVGHFEKEPYR